MPLDMKYTSFYQGRDITQPQGSILPCYLITKHEDATRKREGWGLGAVASTNLWNQPLHSARHAITHNLLSVVPGMRSASHRRINEMPRWRERNCLYNLSSRCPCGISKNKSNKRRTLQDWSHIGQESCAASNSQSAFFFVHLRKLEQSQTRSLSVDGTTGDSKGHRLDEI